MRTPSSKSATDLTATTGPKTSSSQAASPSGTSSSTVGSRTAVDRRPAVRPPAAPAPCALATQSSTRSVERGSMSAETRVFSSRGSPTDHVAHPRGQPLEEGLAHRLDDDDALDADAGLARGVVAAAHHRVGGRVEVGVLGHDEGGVRAELEQHLGGCGVPGDLVPDGGRPGEGHGADPAVGGQRRADVHAAGDQLDRGARAPGRRERLAHQRGPATGSPAASAARAWR